jgi:1,4-dihydroxy-2-naphthoate octaprenyltransferase
VEKAVNIHFTGYLHFAGIRYWTASVMPALVGTMLPFWLRPLGFSFKWLGAVEFLLAAVLTHAGFSFLHARVEGRRTSEWTASRLLGAAVLCLFAACLLGLHINSAISGSVFLVFGITTIFAGILYVLPPFHFYMRVGGEVVISEGLGMLPVLGAYLVQVGDLTRTVYLASLPLVVATALWVWMDELITMRDDLASGRQTMVILFGARISGRLGALALSLLFYMTVLLAIFASAIPPTALVTMLTLALVWRVVSVSWKHHDSPTRMLEARKNARWLHLVTSLIFIASSISASFS